MKPPDDDDPSVNDEPVVSDVPAAPAPVTIEEPAIVSYSAADFETMLGSYNDLALHVVIGDDHGDHQPRARVGRYERRDP